MDQTVAAHAALRVVLAADGDRATRPTIDQAVSRIALDFSRHVGGNDVRGYGFSPQLIRFEGLEAVFHKDE